MNIILKILIVSSIFIPFQAFTQSKLLYPIVFDSAFSFSNVFTLENRLDREVKEEYLKKYFNGEVDSLTSVYLVFRDDIDEKYEIIITGLTYKSLNTLFLTLYHKIDKKLIGMYDIYEDENNAQFVINTVLSSNNKFCRCTFKRNVKENTHTEPDCMTYFYREYEEYNEFNIESFDAFDCGINIRFDFYQGSVD